MNTKLCSREDGRKSAQAPLNTRLSSLGIIALSLASYFPAAYAAGLGPMQVQSMLGQPLFLSIPLYGVQSPQEPQCTKARVETLDGAMIASASAELTGNAEQPVVQIRTRQNVNEPALQVTVVVGCDVPFRRDYQVLLDFSPVRTAGSSDFASASSPRHNAARQAILPAPFNHPSAAKRAGIPSERNHSQRAHDKRASHSVLRLSTFASTGVDDGAPMILRISHTLTLPQMGMLQARGDAPSTRQEPGAINASANNERQAAQPKPNLFMPKDRAQDVETQQGKSHREFMTNLFSGSNKLMSWATGLGVIVIPCLLIVGWRGRQRMGLSDSKLAWKAWRQRFQKQTDEQQNQEDDQQNEIEESTGLALTNAIEAEEPKREVNAQTGSAADTVLHNTSFTKAEEVTDLMELVEAWFALNRPDAVLEALEPMNTEEPPKSPLPWLYLADAYWLVGDEIKYDDLCQRIRKAFNVDMPDASVRSQPKSEKIKTLADFPHIMGRIVKLWNSDEIIPYLECLLLDDRDGARTGFPLAVYQNILKLIRLAKDPAREKVVDDKIPDQLSAILSLPGRMSSGEFGKVASFDLHVDHSF